MDRTFYLDMAARGLCFPIGTHLVLHEQSKPEVILHDGKALAAVVAETARRFKTPLAVPLMDLTLEKAALLAALGVPAQEVDAFHFTECRSLATEIPLSPRMQATCQAIREVALEPGLVPVGMSIGPFSLTTKLLSDPITPVFMAGSGLSAEDEPEIGVLEQAQTLALQVIETYLKAQIAAGAKAIILCEPAANLVYFSPKQLEQSHEVFERYVMNPCRRIAALLADHQVDLIFHDCGELTQGMVSRFAGLGAAMISFGSSRRLWEDAALIPKDTVLYGNLPTKRFYSKQLTLEEVQRQATELLERMRDCGHPFILGSECDVLSVSGSEAEILSKVDGFMRCSCVGR